MNKIKNVYAIAKRLNIEIDNHESDLYLPVNDLTKKIVDKYEYKCNATKFVNQIDKKLWFDLPFAYTPFWTKKSLIK